ncbi:MAG TPA: transposase [Gemmataceae bacterium]
MDPREQRGLVIAALCKLNRTKDGWLVPSQTGPDRAYTVNPAEQTCTCPDHQEGGHKCKHIYAVEFTMKREVHCDGTVTETKSITFTEKVTYKQDWPAYNHAQDIEKDRLQELLFGLCQGIDNTMRPGPGRKPHTKRDSVFGMVFKVYCQFSGRRFSSDLRAAHRMGYLSRKFAGAKVLHFMENPAYTPILRQLIATSALPLRTVERDFAIDSSGFGTCKFEKWFDHKYGITRNRCQWIKVHLCSGVKTNIVTAVRVLDKDSGDSPQFAPLVKETAKSFTIGEVSADKAYTSVENFETVAECGGTAFLSFKVNATGAAGGLFEKMFHFFQFKKDEYLAHYHKRSNVESTFSMMKRKHGDSIRSLTETAQTNEVLCKVLCHNLCVLIQEEAELGIRPDFTTEKAERRREALALAP